MSGIPKVAKSARAWLGFATAIFVAYAGATAVGLDLPRWTWIAEHRVLAGEVKQTRAEVYSSKIDHLENRHTDVLIAMQKLSPGTQLYNTLLRKRRSLERQLKNAEAQLKRVRGF